ncbi:FdhF/YdeP family oxidoreductase [Allorhizocola rhizosphaerae]|uniref:FdhF/YdeP family oxidoreductase n=1 Tax=Allorhizocola rhizosphaerae TaxID=1872709 RepID=UPI000E3D4254|nr:FdhF/YdeP family oxidoreductase [Allorhizocola rhizosphaerae]
MTAEKPKVSPPKTVAAGLPGVAHGLAKGLGGMGARRTALTLLRVNQADGFDCPGCAWPEPDKRSHFEFCENGAKAVAEEATLRRITPDFFIRYPISVLAAQSDHWLGRQGRLTSPMVKRPGTDSYSPITWEEAFDLTAQQLRAIEPDEALFYTSGRTSNEAAFLYQLFARTYGTNNLPDCSNMCHESSGVALKATIGVGKGTVSLDDIHHARLIVVVGQNPGTNHPRMLSALEQAKRNGARIMSINPLPEAGLIRFKNPQKLSGLVGRGTALSDLHLPIRVGGDLALFQAIGAHLRAWDAVDHEFIRTRTTGFDTLTDPDPDLVRKATGLDSDAVEMAARMFADSDATIVCWAMGLTQGRDAVATIQEIVNVQLMRGMVGKPGAGLCPVRGHSNVQGDRTMGIWHEPPAWVHRLIDPPEKAGYDTVEAIRAMRDGRAKVFVGLGGNFASATPDTAVTEEALKRCTLAVHISTKLNRSHVVTSRDQTMLILPCLGRTERDRQKGGEQFVTVEDSMSRVHASRGRLEPASELLRSEVAIVCGLARATLGVDWSSYMDDYRAIRAVIARVIPGFEDFEARVEKGFTLPQGPVGTMRFTASPLRPLDVPAGRLILQTVRSHDQYNTTIYGLDDRYRGIKNGRHVIFVNPLDLTELGLHDGQTVDIISEWADGERVAKGFRIVAYPIARGCAATYFPEANVLVPLDSTAAGSNTPTSKQIIVRLEP